MEGQVAVVRTHMRAVDRMVALVLLALMAIGCFALWLAVPAAVLLMLSRATESPTLHLSLSLLLVPLAMIAFAQLLLWMNRLYLEVTGVLARLESDDNEPLRLRGPLELMLLASFVIAVIAFLCFAIFIGGPMPQRQVI